MQIVETLTHSDECSGCYVCDDGTRIHWSEGRSSEMDVIRPDGERLRAPASEPSVWVDMSIATDEIGVPSRPMTGLEEAYHTAVRNSPIL